MGAIFSQPLYQLFKFWAASLILFALLVIGILFVFLLQIRAGLIVSAAIPLSMLIAIIGMNYFGVSANLMT